MAPVPSRALERDAGLAIERTSLSWNRTSLALLINGVLAVANHERGLPLPLGVGLLLACLLIAAAGSTHAVLRGRRARWSTRPAGPNTVAVLALGAALTLLCLATAAAIAASALAT